MPTISINCPHCAKRNDLIASEVPNLLEIYCSHCRAPIGKWSELEQKTKATAPDDLDRQRG